MIVGLARILSWQNILTSLLKTLNIFPKRCLGEHLWNGKVRTSENQLFHNRKREIEGERETRGKWSTLTFSQLWKLIKAYNKLESISSRKKP